MSEPHVHPHVAVALRLNERLFAGDVEGLGAIYADDIVVFRNFDERELVRKQVLKVVTWLVGNVKELRYDDVHIEATERGYVQRHVLRGKAPNGAELRVHTCLVVGLRDGRIARMDEYFDSAQMAALLGG